MLFLSNNTPIIHNFGKEKGDFSKFNEYVRKNINNNGIILERKLFGIKKKNKTKFFKIICKIYLHFEIFCIQYIELN